MWRTRKQTNRIVTTTTTSALEESAFIILFFGLQAELDWLSWIGVVSYVYEVERTIARRRAKRSKPEAK